MVLVPGPRGGGPCCLPVAVPTVLYCPAPCWADEANAACTGVVALTDPGETQVPLFHGGGWTGWLALFV